jgi:hypothetical protein
MLARWLALGTVLSLGLLGGCLCQDDHVAANGFASFKTYAREINACKSDVTCAPLCQQALALPADDEIMGCAITRIDPTGVMLRAHYIVPGTCSESVDAGWDDGWDDSGDDGGYSDGGDDGSCSDDGSCDDGSGDDGGYGDDGSGGDDGGYGDDGGDTGDDGGDTGDDSGDDGGYERTHATPARVRHRAADSRAITR